jgi:hypothetical protein
MVNIAPGLAFFTGDYAKLYKTGTVGFAINASVMAQATPDVPIYVGLDFGLDFWGFSGSPSVPAPTGMTNELNAVGVQFLPTAVYRFDMGAQHFYPYFGFSMGPHFHIFRQRNIPWGATSPDQIRNNSSTNVYFELLARPGVDFQVADNMSVNAEAKFGLLNWDFILLPQVGFALAL